MGSFVIRHPNNQCMTRNARVYIDDCTMQSVTIGGSGGDWEDIGSGMGNAPSVKGFITE